MIIRIYEELSAKDTPNVRNEVTTLDVFFSMEPYNMVIEYKSDRTNTEVQKKYFYHITNKVSEVNWNIEHAKCCSLRLTENFNQHKLDNPSQSNRENLLVGHFIYGVK